MPLKKTRGQPDSLLVVAHPDDETLFFGGLILSRKYNWHVICVTDGNADGLGIERQAQFQAACRLLKVKKSECFQFPDLFEERLDIDKLIQRLSTLRKYKRIFTHGILGEYGHLHHQDVSYATHKVFFGKAPIYSTAYNIYPELRVTLTPKQFQMKTQILWNVYHGEIKRFLNLLPATATEGFAQISMKEIEALYSWLRYKTTFDRSKLSSYRWLAEYLLATGGSLEKRIF